MFFCIIKAHERKFCFYRGIFKVLVSDHCGGPSVESVGCSTKYNHALTKKDLALLGPIKVVRLETPGILKASGTETGFLALATIAVPGGSALLLVGDAYGKARGAESQSLIPDFGAAVMERFLNGYLQGRTHLA